MTQPPQDQGQVCYGVGTVTPPNPEVHTYQSLSIIVEFEKSTYDRYFAALSNAMQPTNRFTRELVDRNFQTYLDTEKYVATLIGLGRQFGLSNHQTLAEVVMSQIMNWLMSFRLYLDHAQTDLNRRFGETSEQVTQFKTRTAEAYDSHPGYRFIYKFRNYVQHCGAPLSALHISRPDVAGGNPFIKQAASFLLNRDQLLRSFDWGAPVRADLESMGETFGLRPLAEEAMEELRSIDRLLLELAIAEGARTIGDVREALNLLPDGYGGTPALYQFTMTDERPIDTLSPMLINVDLVQQYERLARGEVQVSDLYHLDDPMPPPIFDPATVRERFRRDNRAVQVMSLWQAEGGGTTAFLAGTNRMIQEDNSVEPLINGLLNMSAVLLHMTAAAIGVQSRSLLGSLLDIYAAQPVEPPADTEVPTTSA